MESNRESFLARSNSLLAGIFLGIIVGAVCLYILNLSGVVTLSTNRGNLWVETLNWIQQNLGWSVAPFTLVLVWFFYLLRKTIHLYQAEDVDEVAIRICEGRISLMLYLFFGIGVIWTAIGMKNALLYALGDLDPETAASLGAWFILERLVRGGILVALSTTIVGGAGGYLMSVCRDLLLTPQLHRYEYDREKLYESEMKDQLTRMADNLDSINSKLD